MKEVFQALTSAEKKYQKNLLKLTKSANLTISEWHLLGYVIDGASTQERLATVSMLKISTLSRQLKSLVNKNMISKVAVGKDRRQLMYQANESGVEAYTLVNKLSNELYDQILNHWPSQERQFLKILLNRLDNSIARI